MCKIQCLQCLIVDSFLCLVIFICLRVSDPFAAVFGNESFGGGFADFSALTKVIKRSCSCPVLPLHGAETVSKESNTLNI